MKEEANFHAMVLQIARIIHLISSVWATPRTKNVSKLTFMLVVRDTHHLVDEL